VSSRWSPDDRLEVVERLQARPGPESQTFFDAHGLGAAYRSAGDKNSKRAKINEALHAAERRGDIDDMLDAAARYLGVPPAQAASKAGQVDINEGAVVPTDKLIFLSHAFADKTLADLLRDTLVLGGVPEDRIFYSSDRSSGIPSGVDVGTHLQRSLRDAGLVLELLSETFLTRPMCLMELGGAWALGTPTYPIVVPPLTRDEATKQIGNVQMGVLGTDAEISSIFDELHDRLAQDVGIQTRAATWNRAIANFKQQLPSKLATAQAVAAAAPVPPQVAAMAAPPVADDNKIKINNISVIAGSLGRELHAEATNHDTVEHSAMIKATFYGADGKIIGTSDGVVNQLGAGRTKTFSLRSVPEHTRAKVEVDTIL
jgi:hypothetical protein